MNVGIPTDTTPVMEATSPIIVTRRRMKYRLNIVYIAGKKNPKPIPIMDIYI